MNIIFLHFYWQTHQSIMVTNGALVNVRAQRINHQIVYFKNYHHKTSVSAEHGITESVAKIIISMPASKKKACLNAIEIAIPMPRLQIRRINNRK
jgi:hypothetical protein